MSSRSAEPPVARSNHDALLRLLVAPTRALFVFLLPKEPA